MAHETLPYNLGELILELEGSQQADAENRCNAERIAARDGSISAAIFQASADALKWQPDPVRIPGIDRIEALCDEWGTGLTAENVRKLRGRLCGKLGVGTTEANALSLDAVADVLAPKAHRSHEPAVRSETGGGSGMLPQELLRARDAAVECVREAMALYEAASYGRITPADAAEKLIQLQATIQAARPLIQAVSRLLPRHPPFRISYAQRKILGRNAHEMGIELAWAMCKDCWYAADPACPPPGEGGGPPDEQFNPNAIRNNPDGSFGYLVIVPLPPEASELVVEIGREAEDAAPGTETASPGSAASGPAPGDEELPAYKGEDQPWFTRLPTTKAVQSAELVSLANEIDLVLITATDPELEAVLRLLEPYPRRRAILKGFVEQETFYLGKFGSCLAAVTKCRMGSLDSGAATLATQHAQRVWKPRAVVMAGVALGKDPAKQKMADVLVASQIISYEPQRVGEEQVVQRGPIPPSNPTLLNRFENVPHWSFYRPDGSKCERHVGPLLSGEKLVDDPAFKAELFRRYPQAIGGEMEGVGLAAAAIRHGVPWIVVKAICDWADGKKHKKHQPLAAAAAVSLVHHVLSQADVLHGLQKP
jgi:nucleoside phosphorylase